MPSSHPDQIRPILDIVLRSKPESVLDIGIGFGKYGFLCREYLELWDGREVYHDWTRRIDGIEIFEAYVGTLQRGIYSHIYIGDALEVLPSIDYTYDLILVIDVLEHFSQSDGLRLLRACRAKGRKILVATPKNVRPQGAAFGNEHETHRFQWQPEHLEFMHMDLVKHPRKYILHTR